MNLTMAPAQFTEGEALELTDYRPVNRFAILSVIFGGLSWLSLLHPILLVLPLFGAVAGFCAAWQLSQPGSAQSGKLPAKWGIFLSLLFGIWVMTAGISKQQLLNHQAKTYALQWFELLRQGKLQEVHQLTLHQGQRASPGTTLEAFYDPKPREKPKTDPDDPSAAASLNDEREPTGFEQYSDYFSRPLCKRLADLGANATYEYVRTVQQEQVTTTDMHITQLFRVTAKEGGSTEQFLLQVKLERTEINHIANWRMSDDMRELQEE